LVLPIVSVVQSKFVTVADEEVSVVMLEEPAVRTEPEKPLVELTGPLNVVEAIETPHAQVAH
jgi:hypothetical protein